MIRHPRDRVQMDEIEDPEAPDFVIASTCERDDETGEPLFWSNEYGWVSLDSATRFRGYESLRFCPPAGGEWQQLPY